MPTTHVVRAGEHLPGIAHQYGFYDYLAVWDHPENAGLKKQRKDPMVLAPDDRVYIPDKIPKQVSGGTGRSFRFVIKRTKLKLRLVVCGWDRKPLGGADVTLTGSGPELDMALGDDGLVEQDIPADAGTAELHVAPGEKNGVELAWQIRIGHLDPVDIESGLMARLRNLGYYRPVSADDEAVERRSAIEEFQCDQGLRVSGDPDAETQSKLLEIHGC